MPNLSSKTAWQGCIKLAGWRNRNQTERRQTVSFSKSPNRSRSPPSPEPPLRGKHLPAQIENSIRPIGSECLNCPIACGLLADASPCSSHPICARSDSDHKPMKISSLFRRSINRATVGESPNRRLQNPLSQSCPVPPWQTTSKPLLLNL